MNLIYFIDPVAADRNLLPQMWATPHLGSEDALPLLRGNRPTSVRQPPSAFRHPARAAVFDAGGKTRRVYVPIPPGFTAHFGWVGTGSGQVQLFPATAIGRYPALTPDALDGSGVDTNATIGRGSDVIGVEVGLAGTGPVTVRAMTLRLLRNGQVDFANRPWAAGAGHSGCQFTEKAGLTPLSVPLDKIAASATLEETGAWL